MQAVVQSSSIDGLSKIWNIKWSAPDQELGKIAISTRTDNHKFPIYSQQYIDNDEKIILNNKFWANIAKVGDSEIIQSQTGHTQKVNDVINIKDLIITGSDDRSIRIQDKVSGSTLRMLLGHKGAVTKLKIVQQLFDQNKDNESRKDAYLINEMLDKTTQSENQLISGSEDNTLKIWNVNSGNKIKTLIGHSDSITAITTASITISQNNHNSHTNLESVEVFSGSKDWTIIRWNKQTGQASQQYVGHTAAITALSVHSNLLYSGSKDGYVKLWTLDGKCVKSIQMVSGVSSFDLNENGTLMVVGLDDGWIIVYDLIQNRVRHKQPGHKGQVTSIKMKEVNLE